MTHGKFFVMCGLFLLATGCEGQPCEPGSIDGAWEVTTVNPPAVDEIKFQLLGMTRAQAEAFLTGAERVSVRDASQNTPKVMWVYAARRKLVQRDCKQAGRITWRQRFIIVRTHFIEDRIIECSIWERGSIGPVLLTPSDALTAPPSPFDGSVTSCVRK